MFGVWVSGCALMCGAVVDNASDTSLTGRAKRIMCGAFTGGLYGAAVPGMFIQGTAVGAFNGVVDEITKGCKGLESQLTYIHDNMN